MSCWQKTKLIGPLLLFNILLPTWDVFSDVKLSVNLFIGGNQSCSIEEKNVQEFRNEFDKCLKNPQEYCQSDSKANYLCQGNSTNVSCMKCKNPTSSLTRDLVRLMQIQIDNMTVAGLLVGQGGFGDCNNHSINGIREIYYQCLNFKSEYGENSYCSDPKTYHSICEDVPVPTKHSMFAILLLGIYYS